MRRALLVMVIFAARSVEVLSGTCSENAPENKCGSCETDPDCGGNAGEWNYCWAVEDPKCADVPSGTCSQNAPKNTCKPCNGDSDCGGNPGEFNYCWAAKDPKCYAGTCNNAASKNACQPCNSNSDCGGTDEDNFCWQTYDPICAGDSGYCTYDSARNSCKECKETSDCRTDDKQTGFCYNDLDKACPSGWCTHDAPKTEMQCQPCGLNVQCGGQGQSAPWYCWTQEDPKCQSYNITV